MSVGPTVSSDIEVLLADGTTWLPLALAESADNEGFIRPKALDSSLSALLESLPLGQKLQSQLWQNTGQGIGLDYNAAYGLYTRTPGIVLPAGAATSVQVPAGAGNTNNNPLVAIEEFGASLFVAQQGSAATYGGRIIRSSDGTGTGGGAFANVTMTNYGGNGYITAGEYMRDLCLFGAGTGTRYLYASSSDINGLNGRLHRTTDGINWASTGAGLFGTNGRNRMWRVFWKGRTGLSYPRLVTISGNNKISYTDVGADPFLAASWIEGVEVDTAKTLLDLGGAKRRVFMRAQDNVFDINEFGETPALQSFENEVDGNGAMLYLKDNLYVASGRTLNRIYVGDATLSVQEAAAQCFPGFGTVAENDVRGVINALTTDQGCLVAAVYNPTVNRSYICWGNDQGVQRGSANPLNWYGPEVFFDQDYRVTRMKTSGLANDLRLWIAAQSVAGTQPVLLWVSLPIAGAPLQDLISGGAMRFATGSGPSSFYQPYCRLELLPTEWTGATAIVDQHVLLTRGLSVVRAADGTTADDGLGTKLTLEVKADPAPGAITWPAGTDVTITPSQTITPATVAKGERIRRRIKFFSPKGSETLAANVRVGVLDACRIDSWISAPTAVEIPLTVHYGAGVLDLGNTGHDAVDPDYITAQLALLTSSGRTTVKTRDGKRWTAKFRQLLDSHTEYTNTGPYTGKVVTTKLDVVFLAGPL